MKTLTTLALACSLGLAKKTVAIFLERMSFGASDGDGLDGDRPVNTGITCPKNGAHGAAAKLGENLISPKLLHGFHQ